MAKRIRPDKRQREAWDINVVRIVVEFAAKTGFAISDCVRDLQIRQQYQYLTVTDRHLTNLADQQGLSRDAILQGFDGLIKIDEVSK